MALYDDVTRSANDSEVEGTVAEQTSDKAKAHRFWMSELKEAAKREREWRKDAREVVVLYEGDKEVEYQYNILYANVETLSPALYNETPRPVVARRFKDDDPVGKMASTATQRTLEFLCDTNQLSHSSFDTVLKRAVLEALVPGRGISRFYFKDENGTQSVCGQEWPWDRFRHSYGKTWNDVWWIGFDHYMTKDELVENFGKEIAEKIPLKYRDGDLETEEANQKPASYENEGEPTLALVTEIWDRSKRRIVYVADSYIEGPLKELDDPFRLEGFFPIPRPLCLFAKVSTLVPTTLYRQYKQQHRELNALTVRINVIIRALRVRGVYDSRLSNDLWSALAEADDGKMVPAEGMVAMSDVKSLDNAIWMMPIDKLVGVLQALYLQREQCKKVIYEIMGLADILRGSSVASETATAQDIKAKWGGLRLKRMQKEVQRYCVDALRIMGELSMTLFSPETLRSITGLPYPTLAEQTAARQQLEQMKAQAQMAMVQAQIAGQPPAPPPPPDPKLVEAAGPGWPEVLAVLKNDIVRSYRIDIESNSTIDPEAAEDQKQIAEVLGAVSQTIQGLAPLIQARVMPFEVAQSLLLAVVRRFRFGVEIEDYIKKMAPPQPEAKDAPDPPDPAEMAKVEMEKQEKTARFMLDKQKQEFDQSMAAQTLEFERQRALVDAKLKAREIEQSVAIEQVKLANEAKIKLDSERIKASQSVNAERVKADAAVRTAEITAAATRESSMAEHHREMAKMSGEEAKASGDKFDQLVKLVENVTSKAEKSSEANQTKVLLDGLKQVIAAIQSLNKPTSIAIDFQRDSKGITSATATKG